MAAMADQQKIDTLWDLFDIDGDGSLDRGEIEALLSQMGKEDVDLEEVFAELDANNDGSIDKDEFSAWYQLQEESEMDALLDSINIEGFLSGSEEDAADGSESDVLEKEEAEEEQEQEDQDQQQQQQQQQPAGNGAKLAAAPTESAIGRGGLVTTRLSMFDRSGQQDTSAGEVLHRPPLQRSEEDLQLLLSFFGQSCAFIKGLRSETLRLQVCRRLVLEEVGLDVTVFEQGDVGDKFFVVVSGGVRLLIDDDEISVLGAGESFGELSLTGVTDSERQRATTVITTCDTSFATLDRSEYRQLVDGRSTENMEGIVGAELHKMMGAGAEPSFPVKRGKLNQKSVLKVGSMSLQIFSAEGSKPPETHLYKGIHTWEALDEALVLTLVEKGKVITYKTLHADEIDDAMRKNVYQLAKMQKDARAQAEADASQPKVTADDCSFRAKWDNQPVEVKLDLEKGILVYSHGVLTNQIACSEIKTWYENALQSVRVETTDAETLEFELFKTAAMCELLHKLAASTQNESRVEAQLTVGLETHKYSVKKGSKSCDLNIGGMSVQIFNVHGTPMGNLLFATLDLDKSMTTSEGLVIVEKDSGKRHTFKTDRGQEIFTKLMEKARPLVQMENLVQSTKVPPVPVPGPETQAAINFTPPAMHKSVAPVMTEPQFSSQPRRSSRQIPSVVTADATAGSWCQNLCTYDSANRATDFAEAARWTDLHLERIYPLMGRMVEEMCMAAPPPCGPSGGKGRVADLFVGASFGRASKAILSAYPKADLTVIDFDKVRTALSKARISTVAPTTVNVFQPGISTIKNAPDFRGCFPASTYDLVITCLGMTRIADTIHVSGVEDTLSLCEKVLSSVWAALEPGGHVIIGEQAGCLTSYSYLRLLEELGFAEVDLSWKNKDFFVCGGRRPKTSSTVAPHSVVLAAAPAPVSAPESASTGKVPSKVSVTFIDQGSLGLKSAPPNPTSRIAVFRRLLLGPTCHSLAGCCSHPWLLSAPQIHTCRRAHTSAAGEPRDAGGTAQRAARGDEFAEYRGDVSGRAGVQGGHRTAEAVVS